ncbi:MAG: alpha/beta hydrolase [Pseudomonadota bacterium]
MNIVYAVALFIIALLFVLAGISRIGAWQIERSYPPIGEFKTVNNTKMHYTHIKGGASADLPPIVFIHGASGNLRDQMNIYGKLLKGRSDLIFLDRPGHGYSTRGPASNSKPDGQAATIAALLDALSIDKAIIVGHSFGGIVTVSFALNHPEKTAGTVLLSPVSHPWPGGVSWYYELSKVPVLGYLFSETLALPAGLSRLEGGTACVFAPNKPAEKYTENTAVSLVLRPNHFRNNARDVAGLYDYVTETQSRYNEIKTPMIIITGDSDTVVLPNIHSTGLNRDVENTELLWVKNVGHKTDYIVSDLVVAAIENLNGSDNDLPKLRDQIETRIKDDAFGPIEMCLNNEEIRKSVLEAQNS